MNPTTESIYSLIAKNLTDRLNQEEAQALETWKTASDQNLQEYNDFIDVWSKAGSMKMPLALGNEKALRSIRRHGETFRVRKRWISWGLQAAAVLTLSVLLSGIYSTLTREQSSEITASTHPVYQEIKAAYGTQAKVELTDGTMVTLNSGSKLRFPQSFDHQEQRKVILEGEGYFTVAKNEKLPFVVQTHQLDIQVLGTTFNVDAYTDNQTVMVALIEGSVKLQSHDGKGNKDQMNLMPGEIASLSLGASSLVKTKVPDLYKYTAWVNGRIVFFSDPIQTVVKKLEKWYNVEIVFTDPKLENYQFTGTFIDESLEQVLNILSLTSPMTYVSQPAVKQADQSMSKRKIILKSRN